MRKFNITIKQKQIASLIAHTLPKIIFQLFEINFSIYEIYVSKDISVAKIYIDSFQFDINELLEILNLNNNKISHSLIKELNLHKKLEIRFLSSKNINPIII
jgi:ribosome-binding factor A